MNRNEVLQAIMDNATLQCKKPKEVEWSPCLHDSALAILSNHLDVEIRIKPVGHVHASSMLMYAADAGLSQTPWIYWSYKISDHKGWIKCATHPSWNSQYKYARSI